MMSVTNPGITQNGNSTTIVDDREQLSYTRLINHTIEWFVFAPAFMRSSDQI